MSDGYEVKSMPGGLALLVKENNARFYHIARGGLATYGGLGLIVFSSDDTLSLKPLDHNGRALCAGTLMPVEQFDALAKAWLERRGCTVTKGRDAKIVATGVT